jgi:DNA processing protein
MNENIHLWLNLAHFCHLRANNALQLLTIFDNDIERLFSANLDELTAINASETLIDAILHPNWQEVDKIIAKCRQNQLFRIICFADDEYPTILKEIADPPLILYVAGNATILNTTQIAIVGTRNPSFYGIENSYVFAKNLAEANLTITSGFAMGIDAIAHKGAIAGNGKTIGVLGAGIDIAYPQSNSALRNKIFDHGGALISEFSFGLLARPRNFPHRNRIISGLSRGVIVIEAAKKSGSLITARLANEQGRLVFAIPGAINNPLAHGSNALIRDGAIIIEKPEDVFYELGMLVDRFSSNLPNPKTQLSFELNEMLGYIDYFETSIDLIVARSGLPVAKIFSNLLFLETNKYIKSTGIGYVRMDWENGDK